MQSCRLRPWRDPAAAGRNAWHTATRICVSIPGGPWRFAAAAAMRPLPRHSRPCPCPSAQQTSGGCRSAEGQSPAERPASSCRAGARRPRHVRFSLSSRPSPSPPRVALSSCLRGDWPCRPAAAGPCRPSVGCCLISESHAGRTGSARCAARLVGRRGPAVARVPVARSNLVVTSAANVRRRRRGPRAPHALSFRLSSVVPPRVVVLR